jgi:hypothetical protein
MVAIPVPGSLATEVAERTALAPVDGTVNVTGMLARRFPLASYGVAWMGLGNGE